MIAFGGGSAIDAAKAILFFSAKQRDVRDVLFAAIPTTSGTGSEVSRFAVITDREKEVKYPLVDDGLLPHAAVLDPVLTVSVPPAVTADTGIDVFTHAVEAFVSTAHTDFSDAAAEKALKLAYRNLLEAYRDPENLEARQKMHNASCLAGIAFSNSGLGLNHGMAHALGAHFHISHGRANGILLPYVMSFNAGCIDGLTPTAKRYAQISRLLRLDSSSVRQSALQLIRTIRNSMDKLGMPSTIKDAGVPQAEFEADVEAMAADALAALTEYGAPVVIIDAGTVTTIAAVDKERTYLGGCILPGLRAGAALLQETAALLPSIELTGRSEECLGRTSAGAMRSGLLLGSAMMVDGFLDRYTALPGMAGAKCVATGGSADLATAHCRREIIRDPDLTLKGLRYLYEANRPKRRHP